eukprot:TRINITY_DN5985_c0_g1_i15.p3 TRINITY_DN5985_c0_g1~~TRINITY_DN5985_c0_g1_i15.p3  ORF type:complete len:241 (-),score=47.93 TRINITY_DN5985_c0_g1_i15:944-1606(-)
MCIRDRSTWGQTKRLCSAKQRRIEKPKYSNSDPSVQTRISCLINHRQRHSQSLPKKAKMLNNMQILLNCSAAFVKKYYDEGVDILLDCLNVPEYRNLLNAVEAVTLADVGINPLKASAYFQQGKTTCISIFDSVHLSIGVFCLAEGSQAILFSSKNAQLFSMQCLEKSPRTIILECLQPVRCSLASVGAGHSTLWTLQRRSSYRCRQRLKSSTSRRIPSA